MDKKIWLPVAMANLPLLVQYSVHYSNLYLQAAIHLQDFVASYFHASWSNPSKKHPIILCRFLSGRHTPPSTCFCKILRAPPRSGGWDFCQGSDISEHFATGINWSLDPTKIKEITRRFPFPKGWSLWQLWICNDSLHHCNWIFRTQHLLRKKRCSLSF